MCAKLSLIYQLSSSAPSKDIQRLTIRGSGEYDVEAVLDVVLSDFPALRALDLEGFGGDFWSADALTESHSETLARLDELNLSHCRLAPKAVATIRDVCSGLTVLKLDGLTLDNGATSENIVSLVHSSASTLRVLHLDGADCGDELLQAAGNCPHLREFSVSFSELLTDEGLEYLRGLDGLERLRLKKAQHLSADALHSVLDDRCWPRLARLDLAECTAVTDAVVSALPTACPHLTHVALCWCWLVVEGGIEALLTNAPALRLLDATGLKALPDAALTPLLNGGAPALRELNLRMCNQIDLDLLDRLAAARPQLLVVDYYGTIVGAEDESITHFSHDFIGEESD